MGWIVYSFVVGAVLGCWIASIFIIPVFLGAFMVACGFSIKNDVNWYFGRVLEEQGQDVGNYITPPTLFIAVGFFLLLLSFFFIVVIVWNNRILYNLYCVLNGCILVIQISALALLLIKGDFWGQMPRNTMVNSMSKYYNASSAAENVYRQFCDYLQTNEKCCGVHGYADWILASQAPEVGFIPTSCCTEENKGVENCTEAITKDNMNSLTFVKKLIFTEGCLAKNTEYSYILLLKISSGFGIFFQVFLMIIGVYYSYYGRTHRDEYENITVSHSTLW